MHPLLRFTLELFESNQPPALAQPGQAAIETIAKKPPVPTAPTAPAAPAESVITAGSRGAGLVHPQANREVMLDGQRVAYLFQRAPRRSIGFSVGVGGLRVRAPRWVTLAQVDAALQDKARWILQKLAASVARQADVEQGRLRWQHGMELPYLGASVVVVLDATRPVRAGAALIEPAPGGGVSAPCLHLALPLHATPVQIRAAVQRWLMAQARAHFTERLNHFAPQLQVQWRQLGLSQAATRWGSARSDGAIRLNWRLLHFDLAVIDYVVVHELSHLRVMDHSPRFWDTVRSVLPDFAVQRQRLKTQPAPRWD